MRNAVIRVVSLFFVGYVTVVLFLYHPAYGQHTIVALTAFAFLLPFPLAMISLYGILRHGSLAKISLDGKTTATLILRIVTRGKNVAAVQQTVHALDTQAKSFTRHTGTTVEMEVVSDDALSLPKTSTRTKLLIVPTDFTTKSGTTYKARALHYANTVSDANDLDYIVHLDEETRLTQHTLYAIVAFINKHKDNPTAIGQGAIEYSRTLKSHPVFTLADSLRVADDMGRFRLLFKQGFAKFGMKGSFIVCLVKLEKQIGFDIGRQNSITEDAYFALKATQLGYRFDFIEGFCHEQSPFSITDFIKQRERWFKGIGMVLRDKELSYKTKGYLSIGYLLWATSPLVIGATVINALLPTELPLLLRLVGNITFATYVFFYLYGFMVSMSKTYYKPHPLAYVGYLFAQVLLIPIFSTLEAAAVVKGLTSRQYAFHVVQK